MRTAFFDKRAEAIQRFSIYDCGFAMDSS